MRELGANFASFVSLQLLLLFQNYQHESVIPCSSCVAQYEKCVLEESRRERFLDSSHESHAAVSILVCGA